MVSMNSLYQGRIREAERASRRARHLLDYAQNPSLILGLLGDWIHALLHLGEWQEVVELGDHAIRVWNDSHEAIGPGRMAFWCGLEVARATRDRARASQLRDAILQMAANLPAGPILTAYAQNDLDALAELLRPSLPLGYARVDLIERTLSVLNDAGHRIDMTILEEVGRYAALWNTPLITTQVLRARGDFAAAAEMSGAVGDQICEARAQIELATAEGRVPGARWIDVLTKAGDVEFLESHHAAV
jgi:hypothetical protein